ncbi:MAG: hypothetical protein D6790_06265 [Caldilineae bacterium]|nr:MAG: hypothetical protein D6790_06265 [Caldilineae bacterium]
MKAELYLEKMDQPVSVLEEVQVLEYASDNHDDITRTRIFYRTKSLNAGKTMVELHRDRKMTVRLEDGRTGHVLLAHSSMDSEGKAVGVLRVLGSLS